jgi:hypothetical protein
MSLATHVSRSLAILVVSAIAGNLYAISVQTMDNPVPNGFIKIDGDYSDWLSVAHYQADTVGDTAVGGLGAGVDILEGAVAHDDNFIYVLWRNSGPGGITASSNWVWFDVDNNATTGRTDLFGVAAPLARGTEYNLGGLNGWNQWAGPAGAYTGGAAGKLAAAGSTTGSGGADFIEWSISRTAAQPGGLFFNPTGGTTLQFFYVTEATTSDTYPNNQAADWFTYDTAGSYNFGVPGDANGNGVVDINDYLTIRSHSFTHQLLGQNGDANDDGFVDFGDFQVWKAHFPGGAGAADAAIASLGVPEPASLALCSVVGAVLLLAAGGRRSNR